MKKLLRIEYIILSVASVGLFIYCVSSRDLKRLLPSIIGVIFTIIICVKNFKKESPCHLRLDRREPEPTHKRIRWNSYRRDLLAALLIWD